MNIKRRLKRRTMFPVPRPTLTGNFIVQGVKVGHYMKVTLPSPKKVVIGRVTSISGSSLELRVMVNATKKANA